MDNMKLKTKNKVVFAEFPNRKELTLTMGRLGEFYESAHKHIRNKHFSVETFLDTFMDSDGNISYFSDWSGYNIPGNIVLKFLHIFEYDDITEREMSLIDKTDEILWDGFDEFCENFSSGNFYLIAYMKGDTDTIDHEICHAAYYLNKDYKKAVNKLVKSLDKDLVDHMTEILIKMGYNKAVCVDEINAYLSTSTTGYLKKRFGLTDMQYVVKDFKELAKPILKEYHV